MSETLELLLDYMSPSSYPGWTRIEAIAARSKARATA
jgi:2-hydroxychromene-2-carboxylate isomerase